MQPEQFYFDGMQPEPAAAGVRLTGQHKRVFDYMADREWHTLADISAATGIALTTVSTPLRDLRKPQFGARTVEKRRHVPTGIDEGAAAVWQYRLKM